MEEERKKAEGQVKEGSNALNINKCIHVYKEKIGNHYSGHYKQQ